MFDDFTFSIPRCVFGVGSSKKLGALAERMGCSKALCIYDKGVKAAGIIEPIVAALNKDGISTVETDEVMPDPPMYLVDKVAKLGRDEKVDLVIAIGGGSSIDTGKAARMLMVNPGKAADYTVDEHGPEPFKKKGLPYIVVPTTAGTGSEVTLTAVLTDLENDRKATVRDNAKMQADYAVLDPEVALTVPPHVTAACGMDALTHAAEGYLKPNSMPFGEAMSLYATKLCIDNIEEAVKDGQNLEVRAKMMIAATMAGIGFSSTGVQLGHGLAHAMGAAWHIPHGVGCALALPYLFEHVGEMMPQKMKNLADAMSVELSNNATPAEVTNALINRIWALNKAIGIPTPKELGKTIEKDLDKILEYTAREKRLCQLSGRPFTPEDSVRYYTNMFNR